MIDRYSRPEMKQIWSQQNKYQCWLDVELAACRAMNKLGIVSDEDLKVILEKANFDADRVDEIELTTKHDVIAFLTNVAEYVGEPSRWIHYGMTSSDVLDTALALQMKQAAELILQQLKDFTIVLKNKALEHKNLLTIGRSHGIHAEPTSFGLKFALWYDEIQRNIQRLDNAIKHISVGQFSGAVGNYAHISPELEKIACEHLNLTPVNIATQIIQRDRHSEFLAVIAIIGSTLEKIAVEIRHCQRTEVLEMEESFSKGQKGSSAMPHKKNPITSEQISGLARVLRANSMAAMENNALWHERDISHSSVERIILPDSTILLHYMLFKMTALIDNIVVYPEHVKRNLNLTNGLVFSQVLLLKLAENGCSREDSYAIIQRNAMRCWNEKVPFQTLVEQDEEVMKYVSKEDINEVFSYDRYLKNVDYIYNRIGLI
ncbi:MAG TPA: adenylosuccinate lyase [Candidatus Cloacimonadota bacterium]|jgi:adenylosuccinate lyase|nr:adenylosuccinate lyase [Candidatus Cloacimonadales bacterium]HPY95851.1 adenylosuccinate lyase [Candidatus Cloacimonadota bacterium]HQB41054.1 adenylosuccinate lyase [Candidatus Cloacimonadota bacterium]